MSHHVVHLLKHGTRVSLERGQLCCSSPEGSIKKLPMADLRAVIVAARGISITPDALAAILDADAMLLHCNAHYKPCGLSVSLSRIASHAAFDGQVRGNAKLNTQLWRQILHRKIANQAACLRRLGVPSAYLEYAAKAKNPHEGNCARHYWKSFFSVLGLPKHRRLQQCEEADPNSLLNYGYAVASSLCHRSLLVHGLIPQMGLFHRSRYKAFPLVYDFVEPFRPFVDWLMALHVREAGTGLEAWAKKIGESLASHRIPYEASSVNPSFLNHALLHWKGSERHYKIVRVS